MHLLNIRKYLIIAILVLISGCGFKLRTAQSLPPQLHKIYYQTDKPYGTFEVSLKRALKSSDITLLTSPQNNSPILSVVSDYNYGCTSTIATTNARTYNLSYAATISISDVAHKQLILPQTVSTLRTITLQMNETIETSIQVKIVKQEMLQELTNKILHVLCSKKTFQALATGTIS